MSSAAQARLSITRFHASEERVAAFVEWLADEPCKGNGSGQLCRVNSPDDPSWCCVACRAFLLRYGPPEKGT